MRCVLICLLIAGPLALMAQRQADRTQPMRLDSAGFRDALLRSEDMQQFRTRDLLDRGNEMIAYKPVEIPPVTALNQLQVEQSLHKVSGLPAQLTVDVLVNPNGSLANYLIRHGLNTAQHLAVSKAVQQLQFAAQPKRQKPVWLQVVLRSR